jgi:hypothetical protein
VEDAERSGLFYQIINIFFPILVADAQQHQQARPDGGLDGAVNGNGRGRDPLNDYTHCLADFFAKGKNGGQGHLEVLDSKGNSHDGNEADETENGMQEGNLPPARKDPDEVHHNGQATWLVGPVHHLVPERPQRIRSQFKQLNTKGNADDGNAHEESHHIINDGYYDTSKEKPEDVADRVHGANLTI